MSFLSKYVWMSANCASISAFWGINTVSTYFLTVSTTSTELSSSCFCNALYFCVIASIYDIWMIVLMILWVTWINSFTMPAHNSHRNDWKIVQVFLSFWQYRAKVFIRWGYHCNLLFKRWFMREKDLFGKGTILSNCSLYKIISNNTCSSRFALIMSFLAAIILSSLAIAWVHMFITLFISATLLPSISAYLSKFFRAPFSSLFREAMWWFEPSRYKACKTIAALVLVFRYRGWALQE